MATIDDEIAALKLGRQTLQDQAQRCLTLSKQNLTDPEALSKFMTRAARLTKSLSEFSTINWECFKLERAKNPELQEQPYLEMVELYEDIYFEVMGIYDSHNKTPAPNVSISGTPISCTANEGTMKLPDIPLKMFDGTLADWPEFRDQFESRFHNHTTLKGAAKFHYLKASLSGPALALVKDLPLTDRHYDIAWDSLKSRYENERMLGTDLLNRILNFTPIKKESESELSKFISVYSECFAALQQLSILELDNFIVMTLALKNLPVGIQKAFERTVDSKKIPSLKDLIDFVQNQVRILSLVSPVTTAAGSSNGSTRTQHSTATSPRALVASSDSNQRRNGGNSGQKTSSKGGASRRNSAQAKTGAGGAKKGISCPACKKAHRLMDCPDFLAKTPQQRRELVRELGRCFNCLAEHRALDCTSKYNCSHCNKRHHSSLHLPEGASAENTSAPDPPTALLGRAEEEGTSILLATALVKVKTARGSITVRALLDSAAQGTFLTTDCAKRLKLHGEPPGRRVGGLSKTSVLIRNLVRVNLLTPNNQTIAKGHPVEILDEITGSMPSHSVAPAVREKMQGWQLADPHFDSPGPVELLIGAELHGVIFTGKKRSLGDGMPTAFSTIMGYVILGRAPIIENHKDTPRTSLLTVRDQELHSSMQKFLQLEEPKPLEVKNDEEDPAEIFYRKTTTREPDGRFKVRLPFRESPEKLGESKQLALRRFRGLEEKFRRQPGFKEQYAQFMQEYERSGVMKPASQDVLHRPHFFLPHHGVIKESSSSTKLRVVFDASAKTSSGVSLNDILHVGPQLLCDIRDVLLRFRFHHVILVCDIRRMYLQLNLHEDDQPFHLLFWRHSETSPLRIYQLTTVTFGVGSSAFQSSRSIQQLAHDHQDEFPLAARALLKETYVDNITTGGNSVHETGELMKQLIPLLLKGKFPLRKWISNAPELLEVLPADHLEEPVTWEDRQTSSFPIMGIQWIPKDDAFTYSIRVAQNPPTKRGMLSAISSVFDPCGWITPVVFWAKSLIQKLWLKKVDWDTELKEDVLTPWNDFLKDLPALTRIRIPRFIHAPGIKAQIHAFGDSSEAGYGAVIYLRAETTKGEIKVSLITAKSKVAPLKRVTLPRLELCAAVLLTTLLKHILEEFSTRYSVEQTFAWSDSTTVLQWLQMPSHRLKTFVANRVAYIQEELPNARWGHVRSSANPADCASRGLTPSELLDHTLWWNGPSWLNEPQTTWPSQEVIAETEDLPEVKRILVVFDNLDAVSQIFERHASWGQLQRKLAYIMRYRHNLAHPTTRRQGSLKSADFADAERIIVRKIQYATFATEISQLRKEEPGTTQLCHLTPYLDKDGLLRVGGRLAYAYIPEHQKHPWILPAKHPLVTSLIMEWHTRYLHAGAQQLQALISKRFWIVTGRSAIRSVVHNCVPCFKAKPRGITPLMGNLPIPRITPSRPFSATGVDYAGAFRVKVHTLRFAKIVPAYLCIFVCMSTKAVHIEVTEDLTTPAFIAALTRFTARREAPKDLYSDCGSNLKGASNELKRIVTALKKELKDDPQTLHLTQEFGIDFHFNPPAAPHQGGLWEAAVKSAKKHLTRVMQGETLTLEEFRTLVVRAEAMLNSRPMTPMSSDPADMQPLTPAHFLVGAPLTALPEANHPEDRLPVKRWQRVQAMAQALWRRWYHEYLQTLLPRGKWTRDRGSLELGDLVLIHEPHVPSMNWKTGRVVEVFPGRDGRTRVATVRTYTGDFTRPVVKLFPLPLTLA